jgi:hypothetical protein
MEVTSNILPGYIIGKPSPSAADGVSDEEESLHRTFGCELVLQGGTVLGLPQVVIITGQNILNRFYYRYCTPSRHPLIAALVLSFHILRSLQKVAEAFRRVLHRDGVTLAGIQGRGVL